MPATRRRDSGVCAVKRRDILQMEAFILMVITSKNSENEFQELRAGQTNHQKIGCRMPFRVQEMKNG